MEEAKKALKVMFASWVIVVPIIMFDAWAVQMAWNSWVYCITGMSLTYTECLRIAMFAKISSAMLIRVNGKEDDATIKRLLVISIGHIVGILAMLGIFSMLWALVK